MSSQTDTECRNDVATVGTKDQKIPPRHHLPTRDFLTGEVNDVTNDRQGMAPRSELRFNDVTNDRQGMAPRSELRFNDVTNYLDWSEGGFMPISQYLPISNKESGTD